MGKLALHKYFSLMLLIFQMVVIIFTIMGLLGGLKHPAGHMATALLVYSLPILIGIMGLLMIYRLIRRQWILAGVQLVVLLFCLPYVGCIVQPRSLGKVSKEGCVTVASYNVARFGKNASVFIAQDILSEMRNENVDIICFQEYSNDGGSQKNSDSYKAFYPYMVMGNNDMIIYSRYPIKDTQNIPFDNSSNSMMWADIDVKGKTVRVFNVHLQTTGINRTLRKAAQSHMEGEAVGATDEGAEVSSLAGALYGNYAVGMVVRADQSETVAREVSASEVPAIVCGDLNDVPYSYVYNQVKGDLSDGFRECGGGWMRTFRGGKSVRIDYIFHDRSMEGVEYFRKELTYSDHYPIFMLLKI